MDPIRFIPATCKPSALLQERWYSVNMVLSFQEARTGAVIGKLGCSTEPTAMNTAANIPECNPTHSTYPVNSFKSFHMLSPAAMAQQKERYRFKKPSEASRTIQVARTSQRGAGCHKESRGKDWSALASSDGLTMAHEDERRNIVSPVA